MKITLANTDTLGDANCGLQGTAVGGWERAIHRADQDGNRNERDGGDHQPKGRFLEASSP